MNIWYDDGINPGWPWRDEVAMALTNSGVVLYFVTPSSVLSSNCEEEVNFALTRGKKLICVHLEPTTLPLGMELSFSNKQATLRYGLSDDGHARVFRQ